MIVSRNYELIQNVGWLISLIPLVLGFLCFIAYQLCGLSNARAILLKEHQ